MAVPFPIQKIDIFYYLQVVFPPWHEPPAAVPDTEFYNLLRRKALEEGAVDNQLLQESINLLLQEDSTTTAAPKEAVTTEAGLPGIAPIETEGSNVELEKFQSKESEQLDESEEKTKTKEKETASVQEFPTGYETAVLG